jgi:hypothetical protein
MLVATPKTNEQLDKEARKIAELIASTQIDQRASLFDRVAYDLKHIYNQGYTGGLFNKIASVS